MRTSKVRTQTMEIEMPVIKIDTNTNKPEVQPNLKQALIELLADSEIRAQIYEAVMIEDEQREIIAKYYK
jgi:hypothetical protein